jgi:hypothetical protein
VEGSLSCFPVGSSVVLVGDRGLHPGGAVSALMVVEAVAPVKHGRLGCGGGDEVVSRQHFPFEAGEERLGGGVVEGIWLIRAADRAATFLTGVAQSHW